MGTNSTSTEFARAWVPEPTTRRSWGILSSCTATIVLCVWTALHLNIPGPSESKQRIWWRDSIWWRKVKWVCIGIFAPEVVLYTAWQQFYIARKVRDRMRLIIEAEDETSQSHDHHRMEQQTGRRTRVPPDITYGFYVVMGGLSVDVSSFYDIPIDRLTLTPGGVLHLAKHCGSEPFLTTPEEITDKSKVDSLAKVIVFFQVLWLMLVCLNRWIAGYPFSILEVHTLVHAACALTMWGFWLHKPFGIQYAKMVDQSSLTSPKVFEEQMALALMASHAPIAAGCFDIEPPVGLDIEPSRPSRVPAKMGSRYTESKFICLYPEHGLAERELPCQQSWSENITSSLYPEVSAAYLASKETHCIKRRSNAEQRMHIKTGETLTNGIGLLLVWAFHEEDIAMEAAGYHRRKAHVLNSETVDAVTLHGGHGGSNDGYFFCDIEFSETDLKRWSLAAKAFRARPPVDRPQTASVASEAFLVAWNVPNHTSCSTPATRYTQTVLGSSTEMLSTANAVTEKHRVVRPSELRPYMPALIDHAFGNDFFRKRSANLDMMSTDVIWNTDSLSKSLKHVLPLTGYASVLSLMFVTAIYAAVHLALWTTTFPSAVEGLLWKVSGCVIGALFAISVLAFSCLVMLLGTFWTLVMYREKIKPWSAAAKEVLPQSTTSSANAILIHFTGETYRFIALRLKLFLHGGGPWLQSGNLFRLGDVLLVAAYASLYTLARIYLVVESFISLRRMPQAVFEQAGWTQYIPHF